MIIARISTWPRRRRIGMPMQGRSRHERSLDGIGNGHMAFPLPSVLAKVSQRARTVYLSMCKHPTFLLADISSSLSKTKKEVLITNLYCSPTLSTTKAINTHRLLS